MGTCFVRHEKGLLAWPCVFACLGEVRGGVEVSWPPFVPRLRRTPLVQVLRGSSVKQDLFDSFPVFSLLLAHWQRSSEVVGLEALLHLHQNSCSFPQC